MEVLICHLIRWATSSGNLDVERGSVMPALAHAFSFIFSVGFALFCWALSPSVFYLGSPQGEAILP